MAEGRTYRGEFHIHSRYSYDGVLDPEWILKRASALGMNVLSITDHDSIEGSLRALDLGPKYGIEVWPGMEITTNAGDVIGIRLQEEVRTRDWEEVMRDIRRQGGLVILPHPFRGHRMVERLAASADIVEVFNGRDTLANIARSADLARRLGKPGIAGSDAHVSTELGNAINSFDDLMSPEKELTTGRSNRLERSFSRLVKYARKGRYTSVFDEFLRFVDR